MPPYSKREQRPRCRARRYDMHGVAAMKAVHVSKRKGYLFSAAACAVCRGWHVTRVV